MANPVDPMQSLLIRPNARTLTLREVMQRIAQFIMQVPSVDFVVLTRRKGDPLSNIAAARGHDMDPSLVREMLRSALDAYDRGNLKKPDPV